MAQGRGRKRDAGAASVIIRREEIIEDGHHGGAWKVAYADFVTAMMAFFLLMWLINAITDDQRRGIAAYFNPLADHEHSIGGSGMLPSQPTPFTNDASVVERLDPSKTPPGKPSSADSKDADSKGAVAQGVMTAATPTEPAPPLETRSSASVPPTIESPAAFGGEAEGQDGSAPGHAAGTEGNGAGVRADGDAGGSPVVQAVMLKGPALYAAMHGGTLPAGGGADAGGAGNAVVRATAAALQAALQADPALGDVAGQVDVEATAEGLRVQIRDASRKPMFESGQSVPNARAAALLRKIAPYLAKLGGPVSIAGHTDAAPYAAGHRSNWSLSSARAAEAAQVLVDAGLPEADVAEVSGHAGRDLLLPADPLGAGNRRIVLTVRRRPQAAGAVPASPAPAMGAAAANPIQ